MVDRYTKIVLTIIAASLVVIVVQNSSRSAFAQTALPCGDAPKSACWVQTDPRGGFYVSTPPTQPLEVKVVR